MTAINHLDSTLRLALLVKITYHQADGTEAVVRWCGPRELVGDGVHVVDPEEGTRQWWESRIPDAEIDLTLGGLSKTAGTASRLMFDVPHGDITTDPLVAEMINGRWEGKEVRAYYYAVEGVSQGLVNECFRGTLDRDPEPVAARGYVSFDVNEGWGPLRQALPATKLPTNTDEWTMASPPSKPTGISWYPNGASVYLHPSHAGKYMAGVFGTAITGTMIVELSPFGFSGGAGGQVHAHVGPQTNLYVLEVWYEDQDYNIVDVLNDLAGPLVLAYEVAEGESQMGPPGTNVSFSRGTGSQTYTYQASEKRCWARVSGHARGSEWNATYLEPFYAGSGTVRDDAWDVLEDIFEDSRFLGLSNVFATGAISAFSSANPSSDADWRRAGCTPTPSPSETVPTVKELVTELMSWLGADLVGKYSDTDGGYRLFPIWRGPRSGDTADVTFYPWDLKVQKPPSVRTKKDPFGEYGNRVTVRGPKRWSIDTTEQLASDSTQASGIHDDTTEQGDTKLGAVVERTVEFRSWGCEDPDNGHEEGTQILGAHLSQPQNYTLAMMGQHALRADLGALAQFKRLPWAHSTAGQVRRRRHNLRTGDVELTVWHGEAFAEATP